MYIRTSDKNTYSLETQHFIYFQQFYIYCAEFPSQLIQLFLNLLFFLRN